MGRSGTTRSKKWDIFKVISEIQKAKFGVLFACTFGGKIWGRHEFQRQILRPTPQPHNMEVPSPWEHGTPGLAQDLEVKRIINRV